MQKNDFFTYIIFIAILCTRTQILFGATRLCIAIFKFYYTYTFMKNNLKL